MRAIPRSRRYLKISERPRPSIQRRITPEMNEYSPFSYVEVTEQKRLNAAREQGIPWKKWGRS